jgi:hypothetical protein
MHQQAVLVTGNANLGIAGTPVNIDDIDARPAPRE